MVAWERCRSNTNVAIGSSSLRETLEGDCVCRHRVGDQLLIVSGVYFIARKSGLTFEFSSQASRFRLLRLSHSW